MLTACLTGCSFGVISNEPPSRKEGEGFITHITQSDTTAKEVTTTKPSTTGTTTTAAATTTTTTAASDSDKTTKPSTTQKKADDTTVSQKETKKKKKNNNNPVAPSPTTPEPSDTTQENCCYLTINCNVIKENYYLLNSYKCEYKDGDTVYDILKRSCETNGISVGEKNTGYGIYIYSIGGYDEDYFGYKKGGWVYRLNGEMVMKSVDNCEVKKGDKIVFSYVMANQMK